MTSKQQCLAIAKLVGWKAEWQFSGEMLIVSPNGLINERIHPCGRTQEQTIEDAWYVWPAYTTSLDDMAEAERHPSLNQDLYSKWLWVVVTDTPIPVQDPWDVVRDSAFPQFDLCSAERFRSATAAQRAKAFLLTFDPHSFSPPPATPPNTDV